MPLALIFCCFFSFFQLFFFCCHVCHFLMPPHPTLSPALSFTLSKHHSHEISEQSRPLSKVWPNGWGNCCSVWSRQAFRASHWPSSPAVPADAISVRCSPAKPSVSHALPSPCRPLGSGDSPSQATRPWNIFP